MSESAEKGKLWAYLFNLIWVTVLLNLLLFPGLAWLFYHGKDFIDGAIVATELVFGGIICTLIIGTTGHLEAAHRLGGCLACKIRGNCPFLGIFLLGIGFGIVCMILGHFYLGNDPVSFKQLMIVKSAQGIFLGIGIPLAMVGLKLLLHPNVDHHLN